MLLAHPLPLGPKPEELALRPEHSLSSTSHVLLPAWASRLSFPLGHRLLLDGLMGQVPWDTYTAPRFLLWNAPCSLE